MDQSNKILLQFKDFGTNHHEMLEPSRKKMIVRLCNDEQAYLDYKQGKFGFEKEKEDYQIPQSTTH